MLIPNKHLTLSRSLFGLGAIIIEIIQNNPLSIDNIWKILCTDYIETNIIKKHSFDNCILAIDLLYTLGAIKMDNKGRLTCIY